MRTFAVAAVRRFVGSGRRRHRPGARAGRERRSRRSQHWSFDGVFGTYDRAALQRGFQVYKEVCSACHACSYLYFRDLDRARLHRGPGQGDRCRWPQQVTDGPNDTGEMFQRPARPSDRIPGPFPNDQAARAANNGALPPDLSLIAKAREGGADYIYAILTGFKDSRRPISS